MTTPTTALRLTPDGTLTELDLGEGDRSHVQALTRALLDTPEPIAHIHDDDSPCILVFAGANRARRAEPNFLGGLLLYEFTGNHRDVLGPLVFTGFLDTGNSGNITALDLDDAQFIRDTCPR
ncbi:hypothetical protein [Streptomyces sp. NPDC049555]|uniref:hypothetical protein n=1 Tax=Streptomyces sp. NPDC049555 TaxID=3154930 RepID=UPI00343497CF